MVRGAILLFGLGAVLLAEDGAQQFVSLGDFRLESGEAIRDCRVGYRTFGKLNAEKSNAVLFPTWFTGTTADLAATEIGPGKLVDSRRHYVIAVDALGNGVSTSASNSRTQPKLKFPKFTIRDMVESQRLLVEKLGLRRLRAVMGISMGGMQTFEWMAAYPDLLERAIPIVGSPRLTSYDLLLWDAEKRAIESARTPAEAMRTVSNIHHLALVTPDKYVRDNAGKDFASVCAAAQKATMEKFDVHDWLRQLEAMIGHDVTRRFGGDLTRAAGAVKARTLIVVALQDHMVNPGPALEFARRLRGPTLELASDCGHLAPGCELPKVAAAVAKALE